MNQPKIKRGIPTTIFTLCVMAVISFCCLPWLSQMVPVPAQPTLSTPEQIAHRAFPNKWPDEFFVMDDLEHAERGEPIEPEDQPMAVANAPEGYSALPPRTPWLSKFNAAKRIHDRTHPLCEACGRTPAECGHKTHDSHHVISVERIETERTRSGEPKFDPALKWDEGNLITLCRPTKASRSDPDDSGCHWRVGHYGKSWSDSNPNVREDAAKQFKKLHPHKTYEQLVNEYRSKN